MIFLPSHCEIQVRTILVCALYSIKYSTLKKLAGQNTQAYFSERQKEDKNYHKFDGSSKKIRRWASTKQPCGS
jgi:hypothetical protein